MLRHNQAAVLLAILDEKVSLIDFAYMRVKTNLRSAQDVSRTVYSLEDQGLVRLFRDGSIEVLTRGHAALTQYTAANERKKEPGAHHPGGTGRGGQDDVPESTGGRAPQDEATTSDSLTSEAASDEAPTA